MVSEKDECGTVSKDDWMHIINKHPSLSRQLHEDIPYSISSVLTARLVYHQDEMTGLALGLTFRGDITVTLGLCLTKTNL